MSVTQETEVSIYKNGELAGTKTIKVLNYCADYRLIKYLNQEGQYRFFAFNNFWESSDKPREIGKSNKIITSLLNSQSAKNSVGYRNERTLSLIAQDVSQEQLSILEDLWVSPKVYLYIGTTSDEEKDWIEVEVSAKDTVNRIRKGNYKDFEIDIILPEWYSISLL